MSQGTRGKTSERAVKAELLKWAEQAAFAWYRPPDARAGSFLPTTCDYMALNNGQMHLIEVKEVNHAYRLPCRNFDPAQEGRMHVWRHAGAKCWVLVYFSAANVWRFIPLESVLPRDLPSWNFSELQTYDKASYILSEIFNADYP